MPFVFPWKTGIFEKKYFHLIWIKANDSIVLFTAPTIQKCKVLFKYSQNP